tara:strand:+ start:426 stop:1385 length:960 start_codon:yes stop_codon:yes gene_type:complete
MGHYALISNLTTTVNERQELEVLYQTKQDIIAANINTAEYQALLADYNSKNTSSTLEELESQLQSLYPEDPLNMEDLPTADEVDPIINAIDAEKANLKSQQDDLMAQMQTMQNEGTETVNDQIAAKNTEIENKPSIVERVITGIDETIEERPVGDIMDLTPEQIAALPTETYDNTSWIENMYKLQTKAQGVKRTSYNTVEGVHIYGGTPFRKNYAGKGYLYDPVRDAFYIPQPYPSWTLNESTCNWEPSTPRPEEGTWYWKEDTQEWVDYYWQEPASEQPFPSWTYDGVDWIPPVPYPDDPPKEPMLVWDEDIKNWKEK